MIGCLSRTNQSSLCHNSNNTNKQEYALKISLNEKALMEKHEKPLSLQLFDYISELDYKRQSVAIVKSSLSANPGEKMTAFQKFSSHRLTDTQE